MVKQRVPNKGFLIFSFLVIGAFLVFFGLVSHTWELYVLGPLVIVFGIGMAYGQKWATYLLIAAAVAGIGDFAYHMAFVDGRPIGAARNLVYLAVIVMAVYSSKKQQGLRNMERIRAGRAKSVAAAKALDSMSESGMPAAVDDEPVELPEGKSDDKHVFRSVVLLTRNEPRVDVEKAKQRLAKWLGINFTDDSANFLTGGGGGEKIFMAKLFTQNIYMITLLNRPYWDSEDIKPFEYLLQLEEQPELMEMMRNTRGAILIDASIGVLPEQLLGLVKLGAALINSDTVVLLSPGTFKAHKLTTELAQTLMQAKEPTDLVSILCSFVPIISKGRIQFRTRGLAMFDLPEVLAEAAEENEQQVDQNETAVQSVAMYQVQRGKAIPHGDTCSIPNAGSYRIAAVEGMIRLDPIEAPPNT